MAVNKGKTIDHRRLNPEGKRQQTIDIRPQTTGARIQNSELRTQDSESRIQEERRGKPRRSRERRGR
jgi:hypothetical protein